MSVSDVLRDRTQEPGGLQKMVAVSALAHAALAAVVVLTSAQWFSRRDPELKPVMTITLGGGTPGPLNGGMTTIGGRPVQAETPPDTPKRPEAVRPPAAKTPEMVLPKPGAPSHSTPAPAVHQAPPDARGRTPTRGAETTTGSAVAETGARGQGFGLSTGGGAGGTGLRLDVGSFCCPDYLMTMTQRIQENWNPHAENVGEAVVKFTIDRDGTIKDVELEKGSGYTALDIAARRALSTTRQLPALPPAYPNAALTIHLTFQYTR
jgi:TonB family protein